ncbi:MAG: hypothetical protein M1835_004917 [Candelina submexicana]|nr:MAG: hypothetical protein M1835_004917 [Candelina submexicana]
MFADFWAGYISGAAGIIIGNPLDLLKVRLQSGTATSSSSPLATSYTQSAGGLVKGVAAPILGYGALNALLFVSYNRTLNFLGQVPAQPSDMWAVWSAGAVGGLATWVVSAPTELIKCRTQSSGDRQSSFSVTKELFKIGGIKGLYHGGGVTSLRDAVGYGF